MIFSTLTAALSYAVPRHDLSSNQALSDSLLSTTTTNGYIMFSTAYQSAFGTHTEYL